MPDGQRVLQWCLIFRYLCRLQNSTPRTVHRRVECWRTRRWSHRGVHARGKMESSGSGIVTMGTPTSGCRNLYVPWRRILQEGGAEVIVYRPPPCLGTRGGVVGHDLFLVVFG